MRQNIKFPKWKGYSSITEEQIDFIKQLHQDDGSLAKGLIESAMRAEYFEQMLLYIQDRLDKHLTNDEPLGLCLNSASEIFDGIMITPCEKEQDDNKK